MSKTSMSIRLDSEVKEQAQQVFNSLGMDMTTAINIFLRQAIQYQGLPFDVRLDESRKLMEVLGDLDQNRNMSQSFVSVSDLMENLRAPTGHREQDFFITVQNCGVTLDENRRKKLEFATLFYYI